MLTSSITVSYCQRLLRHSDVHLFVRVHAPDQTKLTASSSPLRIRPSSAPRRYSSYVHTQAESPFHSILWVLNPYGQSWNGYAYARNNPLLLVDPTGRNYTVCDQQGQNCADLTDQQWSDFRDQNGIGQQAGGQLYVTNEDGSYTNVGTATYYNEQDVQAANFLNYQVAPVINGLGYATASVMAGAAVGAGYGALAGGARLIGSIGIASGPAIFQAGQTIDRIVNTSQGPVRFVAEVETSGSQLILKDILVYPTETGGRLQAGAGQILQAAKGFLQEARQDGFTSVRFIGDRSLAEGSANPGRVVDFTRTLK